MKVILLTPIFILLFINTVFSQTKNALPCIDRTFQVVVHISREPDGTLPIEMDDIPAAFQELSDIYAPICVKFEVCETHILDNFQFDYLDGVIDDEGIEMIHTNQIKNRINFYYVRAIVNDEFAATYQGINNVNESLLALQHNRKGFVDIPQLAHEMGMFFGLKHTYDEATGAELVERLNCQIAGDELCDTPADISPSPVRACVTDDDCVGRCLRFGSPDAYLDPLGESYSPDFSNFMSNYKGCRARFTRGQYNRMSNTYLSGPRDQW